MGNSVHLEVARGSVAQNVTYCTKEAGRLEQPKTFGSPPVGQGARTDLAGACQLAREGKLKEVADDVYAKYFKGLRAVQALHTQPEEREVSVCVYWGPTGTGKSRRARAEFPQAFWKPPGRWWDGYEGEADVIIDDFNPASQTVHDVLRWLDRYPLRVEVKGSYAVAQWKRVCITSNLPPAQWYPAWSQQIVRRCQHVERMDDVIDVDAEIGGNQECLLPCGCA